MPSIFLPLPEVDKSITRPVVFDVVRQVMEITQIPSDVPITYLGEGESAAQQSSKIAGDQLAGNTVLSGNSLLTIEIADLYDENYVSTTAIAQTEHPPVILDNNLGVMIRPIYSNNEIEITFKYRCRSRTHALRWRDDIRMRTSHMRDINLHEGVYHYSLPTPFMTIMKEIHELRENVAGYGEDFDSYLHTCATTKMTEVSNLAGKAKTFAFAESQVRIQGLFGFQIAPQEITKGNEAGQWVCEFTYKFNFSKPLGMHMQYPVMIHNQLLDMRFIPQPAFNDDSTDKSFSHSLSALNHFEVPTVQSRYHNHYTPIKYPEHDEFIPDNAPPDMLGVASALCQVDPTDDKYLLDLTDMELDDEIAEFMKKVEYPYLTKPYKSIFHVSLYRWQHLTSDRNIFVDNNLRVKSSNPLSLRTNHRVRLSMVNDIECLDTEALRRLRRYPNVLRKALMAINITKHKLNMISGKINLLNYFPDLPNVGVSLATVRNQHIGFNTVQTSYIVARDGIRGDKLSDYKKQG